MNKIEGATHIRSLFRQFGFDDAKKIELVTQLRDIAIEYLQPVKAKAPRAMSNRAMEAYQAKGISLEWDLTTTDAYEFFFQARNAGLSPGQQSAAALLYACTEALEEKAVSDRVRQNILDAYAGLDSDAIELGETWTKKQRASGFKRFEADQEKHDNWRRLQASEQAANPKFGEYPKQEQARRLKKKHGITDAVPTIAKRLDPQPKR